jgi:hypothetical protein
MFTTVKLEDFVPADHPLRPIGLLVNEALNRLNGLSSAMYADTDGTSIAPEKLLRCCCCRCSTRCAAIAC